MEQCCICCETYNKKKQKKITCPFCEFESCFTCCKRYLLETITEPTCMSCKKGFTRNMMMDMFPKSFVNNDYKKHRENLLFERETTLLPLTQIEVERDLKLEPIIKDIKECKSKRIMTENEYYKKKYTTGTNQFGRVIIKIVPDNEELVQLRRQITEYRKRISSLNTEIYRIKNIENNKNETEKRVFIRRCAAPDCRGFLSSQWKCGLCHINVCKECHEIKVSDTHECLKENIESAKMMMKETKPCPACGIRIFKISGCSQMWCTQCHVAFNWNTLKIEKGLVHNPHFYEWQRQQNGGTAPRNPGDVLHCGGIADLLDCMHIWREAITDSDPLMTSLTSFHRLCVHIQNIVLPYLPHEFNNNDNRDVRKAYLKKEITEERFKWFLQKREKHLNKSREIRQVVEMLTTCGQDILYRSLILPNSERYQKKKHLQVCQDEIDSLIKYYNDSLDIIHNVFGCKTPHIIIENSLYVLL